MGEEDKGRYDMTGQNELTLTSFRLKPNTYVSYLDTDVYAAIEFKNISQHTLEICKITCSFQTESDMSPHKSILELHTSIPPNNRSPTLKIPLHIDLELSGGTNISTLQVEYLISESISRTVTFGIPDTKFLIIQPKDSPEKDFFLSHKAPDDQYIAQKLHHHLKKIGFNGYVAEDYPMPGFDIWNDKIFPAIDDSVGVIILWTKNAKKHYENIFREIKHAQKKEKIIVILAEKDLEIPKILPQTTEYIQADGDINDQELVKLVNAIHKAYMNGNF